ncbi:helix-turn-helix domain-containing protein, partial [Streptomyces sp. NPDC002920]
MTEQRLQSVEAPRGRGLAPLSDGLGPQERVFAEHLRDLRQRTGMTSADLATELGVDATRLSRYLSGHNLPDPQLLTRLHRLLASSHEDAAEVPARQSRALLYAAARARGPLSARAFEVAELQEKLQEQQAATEHALAGLREE